MDDSSATTGAARDTPRRWAQSMFASGFRPFFLLTALHAAVAVPLWGLALHGIGWSDALLAPVVWHAHEMIYGFVLAAMAGFLLTAVSNWTGHATVSGARLVALVLVWLAGRAVLGLPLGLDPVTIAVVDLAFIPALALAVLPPLVRARNWRNLVFMALLALLFAANLLFHLDGASSVAPMRLAVNTVLLLVVLVGGRIVPTFTSNVLLRRGIHVEMTNHGWIDKAAMLASVTVVIVDIFTPHGMLAAASAAVAALLLAIRLARWRGHRVLDDALLIVLHVGYAWLPLALALKAASLLGVISSSSWLHALTAGAFSTMILAVMSRAILGHTGRALVATSPVIVAYALVIAGGVMRVFGPLVPWLSAQAAVVVAIGLWSGGFVLFVVVFAPMLWSPRVDGRPG